MSITDDELSKLTFDLRKLDQLEKLSLNFEESENSTWLFLIVSSCTGITNDGLESVRAIFDEFHGLKDVDLEVCM